MNEVFKILIKKFNKSFQIKQFLLKLRNKYGIWQDMSL
jgi:hypothetical protein